jgi:hypothetical protein
MQMPPLRAQFPRRVFRRARNRDLDPSRTSIRLFIQSEDRSDVALCFVLHCSVKHNGEVRGHCCRPVPEIRAVSAQQLDPLMLPRG